MKAAAPQAPHTTQAAAKSGRKAGRANPLPASSATSAPAFDGVLAKALAARAAAGARPAAETAGTGPARTADHAAAPVADAGRTKAATRAAGRAGARGRGEEAPAAGSPAEAARIPAAVSAVAALPAAAAGPERPAAQRAAPVKAEARIQVVDLRRRATPAGETTDATRGAPKTATEKAADGTTAAKPVSDRVAAAAPRVASPAAPQRQTPLERLREMTGSDLVKTAGLVVRDGGGEIRLTLKPESLGSVRIRLHLEDGRVEGRIVVDTPEARQAFEAGIDGLARALRADGFETGALQVSVSGGNANDGRQAAGLLGDTIAGARLRAPDGPLPEAAVVSGWTGDGDGLVNVYA